jgi:hypothetical protein
MRDRQCKYPRLGAWKAPRQGSLRPCALCSLTPAGLISVEVSIFRGEDECMPVCKSCKAKKNEILDRWEGR